MTENAKLLTCPYPGLRPFEFSESHLFFGRDGQSDQLVSRLRRTRFLTVIGASGSGKSSLVRAGLLPALVDGVMPGAGSRWRMAILRPGSDPLGNLAAALSEQIISDIGPDANASFRIAMVDAALRRGRRGLVEVAAQSAMKSDENLLIVVDQFEELFRSRALSAGGSSEDEAADFVKLLLEASRQSEIPIYVVLVLRSDFIGDCSIFWGLPEAINEGLFSIPRMGREQRKEAILGPLNKSGGSMTPQLLNRLLNDVGDNPDQLPILEHALMRTWDYWAAHRRGGEPIGLEQYEAIGTMTEALSRHADEAWSELPDERSQQIAEKLFQSLTEKGADNREIRRPAQLSVISAAAEAIEAEVVAVIEVFRWGGRSFLMPPAGVRLSSDTVIDISHESLIRNWDRLQQWVEEEAESARIYRRLAEAAVLHREGKEGLLTAPALQIALDWREKERPNRAWANRYHSEFATAIAFLDASREHRDAVLAAEHAREHRELEVARNFAEKQARDARRLRWLTAGMAVMFLLALLALIFAYFNRV